MHSHCLVVVEKALLSMHWHMPSTMPALGTHWLQVEGPEGVRHKGSGLTGATTFTPMPVLAVEHVILIDIYPVVSK